MTIRQWRIWPGTLSGRHFPKKECSISIKRGRSFIDPGTARQPRASRLAAMCSHIPNPDLDRDNASRGKRRKEGSDEAIPCILESQGDEKTFRRNWARLIQKIYEADPLVCPKLVPAKAGMSGRHEGHRLHRGPFGHPRHSRTPGVMAGKSQAAAQNP